MTVRLRIGYIPLLDSALLHVAAAKGQAEEQGLVFGVTIQSDAKRPLARLPVSP